MQDEICVTVVKTTCLKPSDRGWYMLGCKSCTRETKGTEPPYECGEGHKTADPILRLTSSNMSISIALLT